MPEAAILFAEPLKVAVVVGAKPSEADGADGAEGADGADREMVPAEAEPTGTRVVLLDIGYGLVGMALQSGTPGTVGAVLRIADGELLRIAEAPVLRITDGAVLFPATTTTAGAEETIGVTREATRVEETATGVAVVATTGYVVVQGQESLIVRVVACRESLLASVDKIRWVRKDAENG